MLFSILNFQYLYTLKNHARINVGFSLSIGADCPILTTNSSRSGFFEPGHLMLGKPPPQPGTALPRMRGGTFLQHHAHFTAGIQPPRSARRRRRRIPGRSQSCWKARRTRPTRPRADRPGFRRPADGLGYRAADGRRRYGFPGSSSAWCPECRPLRRGGGSPRRAPGSARHPSRTSPGS